LFNSYCNNKPEEEWETPLFLKIKTKKPLRESPYDIKNIVVDGARHIRNLVLQVFGGFEEVVASML